MRNITREILGEIELPFNLDFLILPVAKVKKESKEFIDLQEKYKNSLVLMEQVHGTNLKRISEAPDYIANVDSVWTEDSKIYLGVQTADCLPIIIYESGKIAVVHSGWKGTLHNIVKKALKNFESPKILIGPKICSECYEINTGKDGDGREKLFEDEYGSECLVQIKDKTYLDLTAVIRKQLEEELDSFELIELNICTCCSSLNLPSHFRDRGNRKDILLTVASL